MTVVVSLAEYKLAIRETNAANDAYHQAALSDAIQAFLDVSQRDFDADPVTEARDFLYNGNGVLEIDDATAVDAVSLSVSSLPLSLGLTYRPRREGVGKVSPYTWLEMTPLDFRAPDWNRGFREMGFMRNLDTIATPPLPEVNATVLATWGWPAIPRDVKRAIIWTAQDYENVTNTSGGDVSSKSVAEVSESWFPAVEGGATVSDVLPPRAMAIATLYNRTSIR